VGLARRQAGAQGQQGLGPAQRLDLRLLIETHHDGVRRRIQIEANDVVNLVLGSRVGRELERRHPMRLEGVGAPKAMNRAVGDTGLPGELAGRPMGQTRRRRLQGQGDDLGALPGRDCRRPTRPRPVVQPAHAVLREPSTQPADLHHRVAGALCDLHAGESLHHQQHRPGPATESGRRGGRALQSLQLTPIGLAHGDGAYAIGHGFPPRECHGLY